MMTSTRLTAATLPVPACIRCGGDMHDNRGEAGRSAKAPDFRCKAPECVDDQGRRSALWARDLMKQPKPKSPNGQAPSQAPANGLPDADAFQKLARIHFRALRHVLEHEAPLIAKLAGDQAGAVMAATATLFIAATNGGAKHR
jgi:hypothetical protein